MQLCQIQWQTALKLSECARYRRGHYTVLRSSSDWRLHSSTACLQGQQSPMGLQFPTLFSPRTHTGIIQLLRHVNGGTAARTGLNASTGTHQDSQNYCTLSLCLRDMTGLFQHHGQLSYSCTQSETARCAGCLASHAYLNKRWYYGLFF